MIARSLIPNTQDVRKYQNIYISYRYYKSFITFYSPPTLV